ncbi:LysR family transcriptional regulator [Enterocloster lavalensis]|uniref:LysR family transcriptional regulator n=1 Tax=Enterocloster lavalensis TaxID=460384 RepID=UPI001D060D51|nr:LysR family transcriptional regulator [Enterocloster lavalensis]MCB6347022.1 LysR family transcriptional regulator [Enterocloster lavalensis]
MDILQLKYFIRIVENNFNISNAAQSLFLTQPALSKAINLLEKEMGFDLFLRSKGRLSALSPEGKNVYEKSRAIVEKYDDLKEYVDFRSKIPADTIPVGIASVVISALFTEFLEKIKEEEKKIRIQVVENGGFQLAAMLRDRKLDFSVLLSPTHLSEEEYHEIVLHEGTLNAYVSENHPLSRLKKLRWEDLNHQNLIICDGSFQTHHYIIAKLEENHVNVGINGTHYSWDYIFNSIRHSDRITILPYIAGNLFKMEGICELEFEDPIFWKIVLVYRRKSSYTASEKFLLNYFKAYFHTS